MGLGVSGLGFRDNRVICVRRGMYGCLGMRIHECMDVWLWTLLDICMYICMHAWMRVKHACIQTYIRKCV